MANTTTTPYMNLALPVPGVETGPQYATDNNTAFTTIDQHTHIPGQGLPVPIQGLLVNADLPLNNTYNLTQARSARFSDQSSLLSGASDLSCLYSSGGDLYYNDKLGNKIRMTASGNVDTSGSGNISGMGSTSATVAYTSINSMFTFDSNTNTPAPITSGPLSIGQNIASSPLVTIQPSSSQSGNFSLTLPASNPSVTSFMALASNGQISAPYTVDNSTIDINASNQIEVKALGITNSEISNTAAIARTKLVALASNFSSVFSQTSVSTSYVAVTGAAATLTTSGGLVSVMLQTPGPASTSGSSGVFVDVGSGTQQAYIQIYRDSTVLISQINLGGYAPTWFPASSIHVVDNPAAGSHTYTMQVNVGTAQGIIFNSCQLVAYEL